MNLEKLEIFFDKSFENFINSKMFYYNFEFPINEVKSYLDTLLGIPYIEFLDFLRFKSKMREIVSKDVFQFSSFNDATINICNRIAEVGDLGKNYVDVGKLLLLGKGIERNEVALRKYGENHSKTANELSLLQIKSHFCFLSCIGKVYPDLSTGERERLLSRLALRNNLINNLVIKASAGEVQVASEISFLSQTTVKRRFSNIKRIVILVRDNGEIDVSTLIKNIIF